MREYLEVLDDAAFGGAMSVPPRQLAVADPRRALDGNWPGTRVLHLPLW
ncbi:hypothetical protein RPR59_13360 [Stakelama saccharophila]|uniref:Uncharacterized protein n=1 Tax=Stakelama saccharophila TaxID=3075605 RepID=A0ABZ0BCP4_9SPHN|nr:hypothetical protein [Stakelama sp. W311]WNO55222.1 hypothetical protein RPR59_13360 [Stakelama sp. W311]